MPILSIDQLPLQGENVLIRVDFNVPLTEDRHVADDLRIRESIPTILKVVNDGGKAILLSHLGRPKGKYHSEYSLSPVASHLSKLLHRQINFIPECIGPQVKAAIDDLEYGEIVLLENLRFYPGEEQNDPEFSRQLAALGTVYVNDAFGTAHRAHASTVGVPQLMKQKGAGYLLLKELRYLGDAIQNPNRPLVAILGGAKVSDKIPLIERFLHLCDQILVGGGMMFTFFRALGKEIGKSIVEEEALVIAEQLLQKSESTRAQLILPVDVTVAPEVSAEADTMVVSRDAIPENMIGVDIGPASIELFSSTILSGKTILWNGPMGIFEIPNFARGTRAIAEALAKATENGATTIVGGGDTAAAVRKLGFYDKVTHVSTGGGASLEFLSGKPLPAIEALKV